ncbi:MAG: TrkH family potassium uptake protein [Gammaproteobacteria bacterium]
MQLIVIQRVLGIFLTLFSFTMLPPAAVGWWYGDGDLYPFLHGFGWILLAGVLAWLPVRHRRRELRLRDGFMIVVLFWVVLGLTGAVPFLLSTEPAISVTDAVFESFSGLTTTGATVLTHIDHLPHAILFYRQELEWLGGLGIIVLAVAVLPMLGVGGMQLYRAETPGPMKDTKLTPRITETAKALWYIYLGLTVLCALGYWLAGMGPFDAVAHSFSTVSIGGFSTHDASMGYFNSPGIELVAVVFMLLSGMNFALHFTAWRRLSLRPYLLDAEVRAYLYILTVAAVVSATYLYFSGAIPQVGSAIHHGIFQAVSIGTTTGFTTTDYFNWPGFLPVMLLFISFIGGCAGSTGGGMKVIRFLLLIKQGMREINRLIHPSAHFPIKVGGKATSPRVVDAVWGFFAAYVATFSIMLLILMATGLDQISAFSAVAACMNNLGPGLGSVGAHYAGLSDVAKWVLCFGMLLGRLEIFTLLVLFSRTFWRR